MAGNVRFLCGSLGSGLVSSLMTAYSGWFSFLSAAWALVFLFIVASWLRGVLREGGVRCKKGGYHFTCVCRVNLGFHFFINPIIKKKLVVFTMWCMGVSGVTPTYPSTWDD